MIVNYLNSNKKENTMGAKMQSLFEKVQNAFK